MAFVGVRELSRGISKTLGKLEQDGEPVIITNHGRPIAALVAVDQHNLEDLVLAATPEAARRRQAADDAIAAGQGRRLADVPVEEGEEDEDTIDTSSPATIIAQLKPAHAKVLGWEPSDALLATAVQCVGEIVWSVVHTIRPHEEQTTEVARRVEQLNTDLYTRLWTHRFRDAIEERLEEITREPGLGSGGLAGEEVVRSTVENAAQQLRAINELLVAPGAFSINTYQACLTTVAQFDEMAHHDQVAEEVTPEAVA